MLSAPSIRRGAHKQHAMDLDLQALRLCAQLHGAAAGWITMAAESSARLCSPVLMACPR